MRPPVSPVHLCGLVRAADRVLESSTRWSLEDPHGLLTRVGEGDGVVLVCRHGQLWPVLWAVRGTPTDVLVSHSSDGELLARLLRGWGFGVLRGSTSRAGFQGAREALRALRAGRNVGLAVDGPRGPRAQVQEGALRLARRAGRPLVALAVRGSGSWVLRRSWDHFEIPRPLGRLVVRIGPEVEVGSGPDGLRTAAGLLARHLDCDAPRAAAATGTVTSGARP